MKRFEYQFGVYIDAENADEAFLKAQPVMALLEEIDSEGDPAAELVGIHDIEGEKE